MHFVSEFNLFPYNLMCYFYISNIFRNIFVFLFIMLCKVRSDYSLLGRLTGRPYKNLLGIDSFQCTSLMFLFHNLRLQGLFYPVYVCDIIARVSFFWIFFPFHFFVIQF